jgi:(p)ppGpp synthase/HD superfamily hydrolase
VAAALLHEVVEETPMDVANVRRRFGPEVAELVEVMSEDERIEDFQPRKQEHRARIRRAGRIAAAIFAADKLVKAREIQGSAATVPEEKFEHYQRTLSELRATSTGSCPSWPSWSASFR